MAKNNLLFELGFEELPVEANKLLREKINETFSSFPPEFKENDFILQIFSTPRRLTIFMENVKLSSDVTEDEVKGPAERILFDGDSLTKAGEGFLKSKHIDRNNLSRRDGFVFYMKKSGGEPLEKVFTETLIKCITSISFDKTMKWEKSGFSFPRPIRWLTGFVNNSPIRVDIAGVSSDIYTYGNRSVSSSKVTVFNGYDYFEKMNDNYVQIDIEKRKKMILDEIEKCASKMSLSLIEDDELLNEVTDLVEYPEIFCGKFDERFLNLPSEIIVAALKQHQRYFSLKNADNSLSPYFIFVSNSPYAEPDDIVNNNQRIITSRLEDAEFYYKNDISHDMKYYEESLKKTVFHEQLGTFYDKVQRNKHLASFILKRMNEKEKDLELLSLVSKFDIATEMIKDGKEFTKLQGIIGAHYARAMGYSEEIADVSREHYLPLTNEGELPKSIMGCAFSIADKIDNISGAYVSGNKPTGSKDSMSVRRDSLALIYLLTQKQIKIDLAEILNLSLNEYNRVELKNDILEYLKKRIEILFSSYEITYDISRCSLHGDTLIPVDILKKSKVIKEIKSNDDFKDIIIGLKRVTNILKNEKEENAAEAYDNEFELRLYEAAKRTDKLNETLLESHDYDAALKNLLFVRKPIDDFFDNVMVMDPNSEVRQRRIRLLFFVRRVFLKFGDFSQIVLESDLTAEDKK
ncbi:MAG: glycine--tRNA ligase subunit beta [bacterium]